MDQNNGRNRSILRFLPFHFQKSGLCLCHQLGGGQDGADVGLRHFAFVKQGGDVRIDRQAREDRERELRASSSSLLLPKISTRLPQSGHWK